MKFIPEIPFFLIVVLMNVYRAFGPTGKRKPALEPAEESSLMLAIKNAKDIENVRVEFNTLYNSLCNKLWSKLYKKFIPPLDIETLKDVFQEGWRKALEKRGNFIEGSNVYNWIYTILHNTSIDLIRREKNPEAKFENFSSLSVNRDEDRDDVGILARMPSDETSIEDEINTKEVLALIEEAIEAIKDETDRMLVKMRLYEDAKYGDIAKQTGIPIATIHYRIDKAMGEMRTKLKKVIYN